MGNTDRPGRENRDKAEGERWSSEEGTVGNEKAGGISNRPLEEEADEQNALPDRGTSKSEGDGRNNEDVER